MKSEPPGEGFWDGSGGGRFPGLKAFCLDASQVKFCHFFFWACRWLKMNFIFI